jgi:hypothetical protein
MNELKGEFVRSRLINAETNPDEWFAELFFMRQRLEKTINAQPLVMLR